jgi:hypothetical protein
MSVSAVFKFGILFAVGLAIGVHASAFPRRTGLKVERDTFQAFGCKYVLFSHPEKFGESLLALGVLERADLPSGKSWVETADGATYRARFRMEFPFFPLKKASRKGDDKVCDLESMYKVFGPKRVKRGRTVQVRPPSGGTAWIRIASPESPKGYLFSREIPLPPFKMQGERTLEFPLNKNERDALKEAVAKGRKSYVEFSMQSTARPREGLADLKAGQLVARITKAASKKLLRSNKEITAAALTPLLKKALEEQTFELRGSHEIDEGLDIDKENEPKMLASLLYSDTPGTKSLSRVLEDLNRMESLSIPLYSRTSRTETLDTWFGLPIDEL